ncbi:Txe/YoeB family addiction module toxin [Luteolibacter algae]|uniref:Putative mRNA interferase YoeB n=1 Tax=Luteolibacter algae TaxID=454151 RepID=A0ABW5DAL8_9BACT
MHLEFKAQGYEDMQYWASEKPEKARRIVRLIGEIMRSPHGGIPQPETLKNELAGWFSRSIDAKNRVVYQVSGDRLIIAQARSHF